MNTTSFLFGAAAVALVAGTGIVMTNSANARNATAQRSAVPAATMKPSMPPAAMGELKPSESSIVDIVLADDGEFDVLQAAVVKAGLVDALSGKGQLTVFAPTDAAFMAFTKTATEAEAKAAVEALPVDALTNVLLYHVTEGRKNSQAVLSAPQYMMLNKMQLTQEELTTAGIATADISASNGIIHVINAVLSPAAM